MAKTPTSTGKEANRTASDSDGRQRPIPVSETDALPERLQEVIGDESVSSFARRSCVPEANIRSYLKGKSPAHDRLAALAWAGGVTIDWLATGRLPKTRAEWRAQQAPLPTDPAAFDGRRDILEAVLRVAEHRIRNNLVDQGVIEAGLGGAPSWMDAARDYPDLEQRLRSMIATLEFIKAAGIK